MGEEYYFPCFFFCLRPSPSVFFGLYMSPRLLAAALAFSALTVFSFPAHAEMQVPGGTLNAHVGATTNYIHRGISRSDDHPAVNGEVEYTHESGVYAGVSASSIDLDTDDDANVEAILFGGFKGQYDDRASYKVGIDYYAYPGSDSDDLDYAELVLYGGYDFDVFQAGLGLNYSPEYFNESGFSAYYAADVTIPVVENVSLKGKLGFQFVDDEDNYVASDYTDWAIGVSYLWNDVDFLLQYTDTDLDDDECAEECGSNIRLNIGYSF